ncbi:hypothetical protein HF206_23150 [Rhizobium leguminosarum]|nr:hypothetical protein [Rhizobium leguminosarum]MBY2926330.1 hypothetical protein [Rhizobium leguminosarum]MBY2972222.1 hypothetical protein [Rhizobium leguminosarum]MBY2979622.1 hypothetical protein [Rhizobium leguminosarum]MBY3008173.1 hypothetical protein [Rhizobium leguminosarum]
MPDFHVGLRLLKQNRTARGLRLRALASPLVELFQCVEYVPVSNWLVDARRMAQFRQGLDRVKVRSPRSENFSFLVCRKPRRDDLLRVVKVSVRVKNARRGYRVDGVVGISVVRAFRFHLASPKNFQLTERKSLGKKEIVSTKTAFKWFEARHSNFFVAPLESKNARDQIIFRRSPDGAGNQETPGRVSIPSRFTEDLV